MEVNSKFADRPMLRALHRKFPGGAPVEDEPPQTPTQAAMIEIMHNRRVMEDPELGRTYASTSSMAMTGGSWLCASALCTACIVAAAW